MAKPTRLAPGAEPLQIFHDHQNDYLEQSALCVSRAQMPSANAQMSPRKTLQSSSGNTNNAFHRQGGFGKQNSPFKAHGRSTTSPLTPLKEHVNKMNNPIALQPPMGHVQSTDSIQKKQPMMSRFKTVYQKPVLDESINYGKENMHPTIQPAPPTSTSFSLNLEPYYQKPPIKRALLEAAPIKEARAVKLTRFDATVDEIETILPPHDSFPPIVDDGQKPPHSYAVLIAMSILRSPQRRLTLSQIYKWISDSYSFYSASEASGWQNSIRHNLSLNKAFIKQERPKGDTGKGHYWAIEPGMEAQFIKDKPTRRAQGDSLSVINMSNRMEPSPADQTFFHDGLPAFPTPILPVQPMAYSQPSLPTNQSMSAPPEVSSDATIPLSDNPTPEDQVGKADLDRTTDNTYSPFPAEMHSSPPIPRHINRSNTPPPVSRAPASSGTRAHKRKVASMDDSGYISSLESSAMRPNQRLNSEADRPRIKRGRAEEEIARLRASSYDSPTKTRSYGLIPPSSSPFRQSRETNQMPPPLTPALKKRVSIIRPPPSVSPNTNLKLHRDEMKRMLESPLRRASNLGDDMPFSPNFNLDHTLFLNDFIADGTDFGIFEDSSLDTSFFNLADNGSPIKRSAKRMRLDRAHSTSALGDITASASNRSVTSVPYFKVPDTFPMSYETPSKVFEGMSSPSKYLQQSPIAVKTASINKPDGWNGGYNDFYTEIIEDENDENSGLDLLGGSFAKIGSTKSAIEAPRAAKPALGRSYTTTF